MVDAYEYTNAEKLVQQVIACDLGLYDTLPKHIATALLWLAAPAPVSDGPVYCANNCKSKSGPQT
jgi:hypothetical protein